MSIRFKKTVTWLSKISAFLSAVWLIFLDYLLKDCEFLYINSKLTSGAICITIFIIAVTLTSMILDIRFNIKNDREIEKLKDEIIQHEEAFNYLNAAKEFQAIVASNDLALLDSMYSIVSKKTYRITNLINKDKVFHFDTDEELSIILNEIIDYFSKFCDIPKTCITISLLYRVYQEESKTYGEWRLFPAINIDSSLAKDGIIDSGTTAYEIISGKHNSIYHRDKRTARDENTYKPDARDVDNDCIGSIICRDISIYPDNTIKYVQSILSLSTYGHQLVDHDDEYEFYDIDEKRTIEGSILPYFESHIKEVLAKIYLIESGKDIEYSQKEPIK